jgi:branched-chain amino acid transport system ATP-binding protein
MSGASDSPAGSEGGSAASDPDDPVLTTESLSKQFGQLIAVDEVDLAIERGEFRSVIGPNGAGKTTLFNLITGALGPTSGTVRFEGEDVTALPPHERVHKGLGRSFQITNVFGGLTVRENVRLAAQSVHQSEFSRLEGLLRSTRTFESVNADADGVLERIELEDQAHRRASTLAYGDRRRLEIGLVLATDPTVVLLDEPTAGMSVDETKATMELISDVLADRTLVLIEHDIDLVMNVSDRVTVLHRGEVLRTGTPREVADDESVQEAYLGGVRP